MIESWHMRQLGRTDMQISRVGFGAWAVGGSEGAAGWGGKQDDSASVAAIHHAVDCGINWIDTAPIYGLGHSEEIVGTALRQLPRSQRPYVFTKCGLVWDDQNRNAPPHVTGTRSSLVREVDESLRRLGIERIDLYQMHYPTQDHTPLEEYWSTLVDLKKLGKVRAIGLSNHTSAQLQVAEQFCHVDTLQPPFSAIRRDVAETEVPWCLEHQIGVIVYSPMQAGLLSGTFNLDRAKTLTPDDWRSHSLEFSGERLKRNLKLVDALRPIAARHQTTVACVAVAWTLAWPGVTGAIVGARRPEQVDGWISAGTLDLTEQDLREIAEAIVESQAGSGPTMPRTYKS